ncbi:MAG: histone family protein [DPANN group archaeon]|nr:histone family protein [DPANN group archaeon]
MAELPIAPFERILRNANAERVSDDAAKALAEVAEDIAEDLARDIVKVAKHAGRKTIKIEDVEFVAED